MGTERKGMEWKSMTTTVLHAYYSQSIPISLQSTEDSGLAGSTLLQVLDNFALNNFDASEGLPDEDMPENIGECALWRRRRMHVLIVCIYM